LLESDYFSAKEGLNEISIEAPLFIPAVKLDAQSKDRRSLGVALSNVALLS
jgi:hypothetical protein